MSPPRPWHGSCICSQCALLQDATCTFPKGETIKWCKLSRSGTTIPACPVRGPSPALVCSPCAAPVGLLRSCMSTCPLQQPALCLKELSPSARCQANCQPRGQHERASCCTESAWPVRAVAKRTLSFGPQHTKQPGPPAEKGCGRAHGTATARLALSGPLIPPDILHLCWGPSR